MRRLNPGCWKHPREDPASLARFLPWRCGARTRQRHNLALLSRHNCWSLRAAMPLQQPDRCRLRGRPWRAVAETLALADDLRATIARFGFRQHQTRARRRPRRRQMLVATWVGTLLELHPSSRPPEFWSAYKRQLLHRQVPSKQETFRALIDPARCAARAVRI